jgi:predicted DNA-binding protein (MmcQ/YjbR family)
MDAEGVRALAAELPYVRETVQWGENLVLWVGDKAQGGKMFALVDLAGGGKAVVSFAATAEHGAELLEREGVIPAPYLARAGWVALERWDVLSRAELRELLREAHGVVWGKMSKRVREGMEAKGKAPGSKGGSRSGPRLL